MGIPYLNNLVILILLLLLNTSCAKKIPITNFEELAPYKETFEKSKKVRIPVILVPGIKGSVIEKDNKVIWGVSSRVALMYKFDELEFNNLEFSNQTEDDFINSYRNDKFKAGPILDDYRIGFRKLSFIKVDIYGDLQDILNEIGGYCQLDKNANDPEDAYGQACNNQNDLSSFDTFSYDWRLDNRVAAIRLAIKVKEIQDVYRGHLMHILKDDFKEYWGKLREQGLIDYSRCPQEKIADQESIHECERTKVNLVTHSMGGLVSSYYLELLGGRNQINKLVMLAPPLHGAMDSLKALYEGEFPESILHFYKKDETRKVIFSWPSTLQLLPRYNEALWYLSDCMINEEAPERPADMRKWGLSKDEIDFEQNVVKEIIDTWAQYDLLPLATENEKEYLKYQIIDSHYFHRAIDGTPNIKHEEKEFKKYLNILDDTEQQKARQYGIRIDSSPACTSYSDNCMSRHKTKKIIFAGYCESTLKRAFLTQNNNKHGFMFSNNSKDKPQCKSRTWGDGRVPVESFKPSQYNETNNFEFFMCEDHGGVVKNPTFQYNLVRELLLED